MCPHVSVCAQWVCLLGVCPVGVSPWGWVPTCACPVAEVAGCLVHVPLIRWVGGRSCSLTVNLQRALRGAQPLLGSLGALGSLSLTLLCGPEGPTPLVSVPPFLLWDQTKTADWSPVPPGPLASNSLPFAPPGPQGLRVVKCSQGRRRTPSGSSRSHASLTSAMSFELVRKIRAQREAVGFLVSGKSLLELRPPDPCLSIPFSNGALMACCLAQDGPEHPPSREEGGGLPTPHPRRGECCPLWPCGSPVCSRSALGAALGPSGQDCQRERDSPPTPHTPSLVQRMPPATLQS